MTKLQQITNAVGWILVFGVDSSHSFSSLTIHRPSVARASGISSSVNVDDTDVETDQMIKSPMRFLGPYPTMPLRFPNLATASQKERNVTGISLDWVLDTAANVNTINAQVALELNLEKVGEAPGGVGAAGGIMGGDTFMLGDCELDIKRNVDNAEDSDTEEKGQDPDEFTFMKELTASALPVASPAAAGLLGLAFFYCFEGGVEFDWGKSDQISNNPDDGSQTTQGPSVTFYGNKPNVNGMTRVPFESLPVSMLPSVTININGKEFPALFDTGSPITVLNAAAAAEAGIVTSIPVDEMDQSKADEGKGGWNPFSKLAANIQSAKEIAQATANGEILTIAGTGGQPVRLVRSQSPEEVTIKTSSEQQQYTELGTAPIFVGDLPGLAALGGLGGQAPPAAVLGMDLLSCRPRIVFRAQQNEIYL